MPEDFKVAFIQEGDTTQHGIMDLSAVLKKNGFSTDVFSMMLERKNIVDNILKFKPDILALSVMTPGFSKLKMLAGAIKEKIPEVFVIMGGPHPTFCPDIIYREKNIDAICIGEGEGTLLDLAVSMRRRKLKTDIKNLWLRQGGDVIKNDIGGLVNNLDSLPFPDKDLYFKKYPFLSKNDIKFFTGRGCPFNCSYCFNEGMRRLYGEKGHWVRFKSIKRILDEIRWVINRYSTKAISFNDDTFNIDKIRLKEFLAAYKKEMNMPFLCQLRVDFIDEEQIRLLKETGVDRISVGIEHGNEDFRKMILRRNITNKQIIDFGNWAKKYKIRLHTFNMIGFPDETPDLAFSTIDLNAKLKPEYPTCNILNPYPGTEIYRYLKDKDYLIEGFDFNLMTAHKTWPYTVSRVKSQIKNKYMNQLLNLKCFFCLLVAYPWLRPIVKLLIKLPYNGFYELIFRLTGPVKAVWKYSGFKGKMRLLKKAVFVDT